MSLLLLKEAPFIKGFMVHGDFLNIVRMKGSFFITNGIMCELKKLFKNKTMDFFLRIYEVLCTTAVVGSSTHNSLRFTHI